MQLIAAIAPFRGKDVAGQTLGMYADQHGCIRADVAGNECNGFFTRLRMAESINRKLSQPRGEFCSRDFFKFHGIKGVMTDE